MQHHVRVSEGQEQPNLGTGVKVTGRQNKRLRQTVFDMVISMAVVLAVVGVIMVLAWRPQPDPVKVVDPQPYLMLANGQASFPVLVPAGLPSSWRPTSVRWAPTAKSDGMPVLHVGYVTPGDQYAQFAEFAFPADADPAASSLVREQAQDLYPDAVRSVSGSQWLAAEFDGKRMLASVSGGRMTVVSGTADWAELEALATSLRPVTAG